MRRLDWFVILLLVAVVVGGFLREQPAADRTPPILARPPATAPPAASADRLSLEAFLAAVPPPPRMRFRNTLVIEADATPRRGGSFAGTVWALAGGGAWLTARHVTDRCRRLGILRGERLPAAIGHPEADVSAIPTGRVPAGGLAFSRDPLQADENVFLVGYPSGRPTAVWATVTGTGFLDHRQLGHREEVVVVAERRRTPDFSGDLGGISGGPVLDADGNVIGSVIGGSARRARSILSTERNLAWMAASAGGATSASLASAGNGTAISPKNFATATGPLLGGPIRVVRCDR
ncbi:MAG: trypsin-like peptidase domain-containing protein [Inquilinus sp.]|nr:trypsin-like peptidase domain-containing protein [Inquilinus sp.]